jgi:AcrR family transcriptional regulator
MDIDTNVKYNHTRICSSATGTMTEDTNSSQPERNRREERMKMIVTAAFEEFAANGFAAARLDTIAEAAGISKGTVYLYFESKEHLFEEVMKAYISPVVEQVVHVAEEPQGTAEAMLSAQLETIYTCAIATDRRRMMRLLVAEGPRFPHLVDLYYREVISRVIGALKRTIEYGVARGEFRDTQITALPPLLMGPALAGAFWKILFEDRYSLDLNALREAHISMLLNALRQTDR